MNKRIIVIIITFVIFIGIVGYLLLFLLPSNYEKECKNRVFPDLVEYIDESKKSIVGIVPEKVDGNNISHNGIGSGVIFSKDNDTYYAVTAAHVVSDNSSSYKLFTINTKFSGETINIDDISIDIPDKDYYDSLLDVNIESISNNLDLAIISFHSLEDLPVLEFENSNLDVGSKIISIGHPEGKKYTVTYGFIKSGIKEVSLVTKSTGKRKTDKVIEHNCYLNFGNSGGVVLSEKMKISGINIGGSFSLSGKFKKGFMIPYMYVLDFINEWSDR